MKKSPDSAVKTIVKDGSNEDDGDKPSDWRAPSPDLRCLTSTILTAALTQLNCYSC
jgi:hypothetical protein